MKQLLTTIFLSIFYLSGFSQPLLTEGFNNSSTTNSWGFGGPAFLTSNINDPDGDGWLRLVYPGASQVGYVSTSSPLNLSNGTTVSFDFAIWGGNGADGMALIFFDGNEAFSPGGGGGDLGYVNSTVNLYAGVGISVYATNFSTGYSNSVAIRGSQANGLPHRVTSSPGQSLHFTNYGTRPLQDGSDFRKLIVNLSTDRKLTVSVQFGAGNVPSILIQDFDMSADFPADLSNIKIALTGAVGGLHDIFELRKLNVSSPGNTLTQPATLRSTTSATLNGSVLPVDTSVVRFLYGTSSGNYTDSLFADQNELNMDTVYHAVSANLSGLSAETQYYFKVTSFSDSGYFAGNELSFRTLAIEPELASSGLMIDSVNTTTVILDWSNSDPSAHHLVVVSKDFPTTWTPEDGVSYGSWSDYYGSSPSLSGGGYLVYNGDLDSIEVFNLISTSTYYVTIFDYYGSNSSENYNISSTVSGSFETLETPFSDVTPGGVGGLSWDDAAWGDFNADGRMDFAEAGNGFLYVFYNNGEGFSKITIFDEFYSSNPKVAWGDYDNDGYLDLAFAADGVLTIYKAVNEEGWSFTENAYFELPLSSPEAVWVDYDLDGDLDLFVTGEVGGGPRKKMAATSTPTQAWFLRNDGLGNFTEVTSNLPLLNDPSVNFGDLNQDGYPDLLLTGSTSSYYEGRFSGVFFGNGTTQFNQVDLAMPQAYRGEGAIGDFNGDGYPDFIYTGATGEGGRETGYFQADGEGGFIQVSTELTPLARASLDAADYDNDGDLDLVFSGRPGSSEGLTYLALNDGEGNFTEVDAGLPQLHSSTVAWGDLNGDGNLDLLLGGEDYDNESNEFYVLHNNSTGSNNSPGEPISGFSSTVTENSVLLEWGIGADNETPGSALTYNLRVGTTSGGSEILKPAIGEQFMEEFAAAKAQANGPSYFYSLLPEAGNAGQNQFAKLNRLAPGTYYWSAQSVDNSYNLSDFSTEQTFEVVTPLAPLAPTGLTFTTAGDSLTLSWNPNSEPNIDHYRVFSASEVDTVLVGETIADETSFVVHGLVQGEYVTLFVTAVSSDELESEFSVGILAGLKLFATQSIYQFGYSYRNNFAIGDFNGDGLNDLLNYDDNPSLNLYLNQGVDAETGDLIFDEGNSVGYPESYNGSVEAADFNNDGRLDVAVANENGISFYSNEGPGEVGIIFNETYSYSVLPNNLSLVWADVNNDGDQDLVVSRNDSGYVFILHNMLNDSASEVPFEYESIQVPGTTEGSLDVADFDRDGDQDILITGFASDGSDWETRLNAIYVNNGPDSAWTVQSQEFLGSFKGQGSWGDFNVDGYPDFISIGSIGSGGREVHLYENKQDSTFTEVTTSFTGLAASSAVWGDLNKDGYPDLVIAGVSGSLDNGDSRTMEVWFNNAGEGFTQAPEYFEGMTFGGIILSDVDGDNDLDIVTLGSRDYFGGGGGEALTYNQGTNFQIHFNRIAGSSVAPDAPVSVSVADIVNNSVTLSWSAGSDENTPVAGLTYNVRLYNSILEKEFVSTLSNELSGERMIAAPGNAGSNLGFTINNLPDGDYEWYVQTINNELNGSAWIAGTPFSVTYTVPVELAEFRSSQKADVVNLFWSTRSETNNYGFEVQKSEVNAGTKEWKTVGFVKGSGTTVETQSYQFSEKIGKTAVSYRLRQLDLDGKESYSQILVVEPQLPTVFAMEQNYPNPFNPVTNIPISIPVAGQVSMKVFDILGREVATLLNEKREAGFYTVQFDGAKLSSGVYFVRLESAGKAAIKKLTLLK